MRAVIQRVKKAKVIIRGEQVGAIDEGLLVLLGVSSEDTQDDCRYMADKILNLRIFEDDSGKMNRSVKDMGGEILVVSQFTLYGDCRKGRRPSFVSAASPDKATELYEKVIEILRKSGLKISTGVFGEMMEVHLINNGPVTLLLDSKKQF